MISIFEIEKSYLVFYFRYKLKQLLKLFSRMKCIFHYKKDGNFPIFFSCYVILVMNKTGEDNCIDENAGDIYLESPLNEETPVLTEDGGSLLLSE